MPVPDETYFGEKPGGGPATYGEAREIRDEQMQLQFLKSRIDSYLIRQLNELSVINPDGNYKVWCPFGLTILTFIAIETIGRIILDTEKIKEENENEISKAIVTPIYQLMDKRFSYKPSKKFYEAFERLHGKDDKKSIRRYSDLIHKYQRNTFNHGFQARGVYLSHQLEEPCTNIEEKGFLIINPYLFWGLYRTTFENIFMQILENENKDWRKNGLKYYLMLLQ
ncbi:MAG TPA: hypothetical protein VKR53_05590 [Puia sp.]|nr:hypothetical protein [Puia sp.]